MSTVRTATRAPGPERMLLAEAAHLDRPAAVRLVAGAVLGALALGCSVGLMAVSAWLISRAAQHPAALVLLPAATAVRAFGIGRGVFRYLERLVTHDAAFRLMGALRVRVYQALESLAPAGLPAFRRGDLLARLVADVDALQDGLLRVAVPYAAAGLLGAGSTVLLWWLLPSAALIVAVLLVLTAVAIPAATAWASRVAERAVAPLRGELMATIVDLLQGAEELVSYGSATVPLEKATRLDRELTAAARRSALGAGLGAGLAAVAGGLASWGALLAGTAAVSAGQLNGVLLATVCLTPLAAFEAVSGLPMASQTGVRVRRSAQRVADIMARRPPVTDPSEPTSLGSPPYDVELREVTVCWPAAAGESAGRSPALEQLSYLFPHGSHIAVVGPSGSGKTTLAWTLAKFLVPVHGDYRIGSVDAAAVGGDEVRRGVLLGAQDAYVFHTTVRENLRIGNPEADEDQMWRALDAARLGQWLRGLPRKLDTMLGEDGEQVSGGQRQRLMLARLLLADAPVVVLDEPTEHLDTATADALMADLHRTLHDRTLVVVTHRREQLARFDSVLELAAPAA